MSEFVRITEVGLRDGLQNQSHHASTHDKLRLAGALIDAGIRQLETVSFVHPKAVPQMADAAEVTTGLPCRDDLDYMALVPNLKGYERALAAGYRHIAVVLSTTDSFNLRNLKMSLTETETVCREVITRAKSDGVVARAYISGAFSCPYDGKQPASIVHALSESMIAAGATDIAISDTIGAGNPQQVKDILSPLVAIYGARLFSLHLHDTRGTALANTWAGIECGIRHFDASIGGLGGCPFAPGATGNLATEDLVHLLHEAGFETGIDLDKLYGAISLAETITQQAQGGRYAQWRRSQERRATAQTLVCAPEDARSS
jgi:hydroxymethylglutaryl-CoA lyase